MDWEGASPAIPSLPRAHGPLLGAAPVLFWALVFALKEVSLWGGGAQ